MRRLLLLLVLCVSCGAPSRGDFVVHIVNASGGNALMDCRMGTVSVQVQQGDTALLTSMASIAGGTLGMLDVAIPSYGLPTQIAVTVACIHGGSDVPTTLIGATPPFVPVGYGFVDVVVGEPETCELLAATSLSSGRIGVHLVSIGANVIAIGGAESDGGASTLVQLIDPVTLTYAVPASDQRLSIGFGPGAAAWVGAGTAQIVVASDMLTAIFDGRPEVMARVSPISGSGLGAESAVVAFGASSAGAAGVAIVGGFDGRSAVDTIVWIDSNGAAPSFGHLRHARRRPAAAFFEAGFLLVAGGQAAGESLFELVPLYESGADFATPFGPTDQQRYAPVLTTDAARRRAWLGLGVDAPSDPATAIDTSFYVEGCPSACTATLAAPVASPRTGWVMVEHAVGIAGAPTPVDNYETLLIGGVEPGAAPTISTRIERVHFDLGGPPSVTAFGSPLVLNTPRASAGATEIGAGVFLVGGGVDDHGNAQSSLEICFPAALAPIRPAP